MFGAGVYVCAKVYASALFDGVYGGRGKCVGGCVGGLCSCQDLCLCFVWGGVRVVGVWGVYVRANVYGLAWFVGGGMGGQDRGVYVRAKVYVSA